eukprot:15460567-Alexandrium_andersonii.AAC.1
MCKQPKLHVRTSSAPNAFFGASTIFATTSAQQRGKLPKTAGSRFLQVSGVSCSFLRSSPGGLPPPHPTSAAGASRRR